MNKQQYKDEFAFNLKVLHITFNTLIDNSDDNGTVDLTTFKPPFNEECFHQAILAIQEGAELGGCVEIIETDETREDFFYCPYVLKVQISDPEVYTGLEL
jgi:hypothetical protein